MVGVARLDAPARHFLAALAYLAVGEGALALPHLKELRASWPQYLGPPLDSYWLGLAHFNAANWLAAAQELRRYVAHAADWRVAWAYLHLGEALEQLGRDEEASLAYRGCLTVQVPSSERLAQQLAFALMSGIAKRGVGA